MKKNRRGGDGMVRISFVCIHFYFPTSSSFLLVTKYDFLDFFVLLCFVLFLGGEMERGGEWWGGVLNTYHLSTIYLSI